MPTSINFECSCYLIPYRSAVAVGLAAAGVCPAVAAAHRPVHGGAHAAIGSLGKAGVDHGGHYAYEEKLELDHAYSYPLIHCQLTRADVNVMVDCSL